MPYRIKFRFVNLMIGVSAVLVPMRYVFAACPSNEYCNPLKFDSLEGVLGAALSSMQGLIVALGIIFIIVGAILYITSAGNESRMTLAKSAITAAMIGLALGIAAPSFLKEIAGALGWTTVDAAVAAAPSLTAVALNVLNFLLSIIGVLGVIMMIVGGIFYLTSAGDEGRAETGKKIVMYSIIGITVALAALVIVTQIIKFFV